jgi:FixJ family two-component response regulator
MNGKELAERLQERFPDIRILYASGYTDEIVIRNGILESNAAFLQKPYQLSTLSEKLTQLLRRAESDT